MSSHMTALDWLRRGLEESHPKYRIAGAPVRGTYGLVWFLEAESASVFPRALAVKTLDPSRLSEQGSEGDLDYLRREFRMWLELPAMLNVLPALKLEIVEVPSPTGLGGLRIPMMCMPRMCGSLDDWVGNQLNPGLPDRLVGLAQALNGLIHLYAHGIEGHGDLKPGNLLYTDLRLRFELPERNEWPSRSHPWQVRVADLGWADAWVDLGFPTKAWRQYLAPERLDGNVVPEKSDMFAMGVIAAEVLQGRHPAQNLKKVRKSDGSWRRWVENGPRDMAGVSSESVRAWIERCLNADPSQRPSAEESVELICRELQDPYGMSIRDTLLLWRSEDGSSSAERLAWAAPSIQRLGVKEAYASRRKAEHELATLTVTDLPSCEEWAALVEAQMELKPSPQENDAAEVLAIRRQALGLIVSVVDSIDRPVAARPGWPAQVQPFEWVAEVTGRLARIAGVRYAELASEAPPLRGYTLAALAFSEASEARSVSQDVSVWEPLLAKAIRHAPDEAVPRYFRAFWGEQYWRLVQAMSSRGARPAGEPKSGDVRSWIADLEAAVERAPAWEAPRAMLERLRDKRGM